MSLPADYDEWRGRHDPAFDEADELLCPDCMGTAEVARALPEGRWNQGLGGDLAYFECPRCQGRGTLQGETK